MHCFYRRAPIAFHVLRHSFRSTFLSPHMHPGSRRELPLLIKHSFIPPQISTGDLFAPATTLDSEVIAVNKCHSLDVHCHCIGEHHGERPTPPLLPEWLVCPKGQCPYSPRTQRHTPSECQFSLLTMPTSSLHFASHFLYFQMSLKQSIKIKHSPWSPLRQKWSWEAQ